MRINQIKNKRISNKKPKKNQTENQKEEAETQKRKIKRKKRKKTLKKRKNLIKRNQIKDGLKIYLQKKVVKKMQKFKKSRNKNLLSKLNKLNIQSNLIKGKSKNDTDRIDKMRILLP